METLSFKCSFSGTFLFGDTSVLISGLGGDGVFPGLGLLVTGAADILSERRRGMLIGCLVVNESDFILDLLGSLLGQFTGWAQRFVVIIYHVTIVNNLVH